MKHTKDMEVWKETGKTFYRIRGPEIRHWNYNDYVSAHDDSFQGVVKKIENESVVLQLAKDYSQIKHGVWGVQARNREQNFALNMLLDPDVDFVTLQGSAGTGKTLLAVAAGLSQVLIIRCIMKL